MSRYRKVDVRVWVDDRVRALSRPAPNGRDCWIYLLTAKETIILPGAIPAGPATLAESLRWPVQGFRKAFEEIEQAGMAVADWDAGLVWIPKAVRYNQPENPNVAKAWGKAFADLPDCDLKKRIFAEVEALLGGMGKKAEGLVKGFLGGFGKSGAVTGAGAGTVFLDPQADLGSGETDVPHNAPVENLAGDQPTEAHWGTLAAALVVWMRAERSLAGLSGDRQSDLDAIEAWLWDWVRKYEPDDLGVERLKRAFKDFLAWAAREGNGGSLSLWCEDNIGLDRWDAERARPAEPKRAPKRVQAQEVTHVA